MGPSKIGLPFHHPTALNPLSISGRGQKLIRLQDDSISDMTNEQKLITTPFVNRRKEMGEVKDVALVEDPLIAPVL